MIEGAYLGRPPVDVSRRRRAILTGSLLRGMSAYSMGAGGFDQVLALPRTLQAARVASHPQRADSMRLTELYANQPGMFKQRLTRMFAESRSIVAPMGYQPPRGLGDGR